MSLAPVISKIINKYLALIVLGGILSITGIAYAASTPTVTATPNTGLKDGSVVSISGTGFTAGEQGSLLECNSDKNQPNVNAFANQVPVSCSSPIANNGDYVISVTSSGNVPTTNFTVHTGTVGPPNQNPSATDKANAAKYPCPPTKAQIAAGDKCWITFGDAKKESGSATLSFYSATPSSGGGTNNNNSGGGTSNNNQGNNNANANSNTSATATSTSSLTNTGPGNVAVFAAIIAAVLSTGYFLFRTYKKARN